VELGVRCYGNHHAESPYIAANFHSDRLFFSGHCDSAIASIVAILFPLLGSVAIENTWALLTDGNDYFIPRKSSLLTFTPTIMNPGSGGWWIYGEDGFNYYWFADGEGKNYIYSPKHQAGKCRGFDAVDYTTWCTAILDRNP
jgi:hypothetical protein